MKFDNEIDQTLEMVNKEHRQNQKSKITFLRVNGCLGSEQDFIVDGYKYKVPSKSRFDYQNNNQITNNIVV